eukprot:6477756-Amphidinium_carterae.2
MKARHAAKWQSHPHPYLTSITTTSVEPRESGTEGKEGARKKRKASGNGARGSEPTGGTASGGTIEKRGAGVTSDPEVVPCLEVSKPQGVIAPVSHK